MRETDFGPTTHGQDNPGLPSGPDVQPGVPVLSSELLEKGFMDPNLHPYHLTDSTVVSLTPPPTFPYDPRLDCFLDCYGNCLNLRIL